MNYFPSPVNGVMNKSVTHTVYFYLNPLNPVFIKYLVLDPYNKQTKEELRYN